MESGISRHILLPDTHIPENINLGPVLKFIKEFNPHKVILMGDMHDWAPVSMWVADQSRHLDGAIVKKCYRELDNVLLGPLKDSVAPNTKMVYLTGNHEDWIYKAIQANPNGRGYWELENNIDLKKYNMEIIPINIPYHASKHLYYTHGVFWNESHAKKHVASFHKSILYGHTHCLQTHMEVSPISIKHFYVGKSIGCLCHTNPSYQRNRPNKWVNSFTYVYLDNKTGHFWDYQVIIVNKRFYVNGKKYC